MAADMAAGAAGVPDVDEATAGATGAGTGTGTGTSPGDDGVEAKDNDDKDNNGVNADAARALEATAWRAKAFADARKASTEREEADAVLAPLLKQSPGMRDFAKELRGLISSSFCPTVPPPRPT